MNKMLYLIVLFCASMTIILNIYGLYSVYTPTIGPIGDAPDDTKVLVEFGGWLFGGLCFLIYAIIGLRQNRSK